MSTQQILRVFLHFITLQQKVAEVLFRENFECVIEIASHFNQVEHRNSHGKIVFLQGFLPSRRFKDNGYLELSVSERSRLLYAVYSYALLTALEMVSNSSWGAGSGEVVS